MELTSAGILLATYCNVAMRERQQNGRFGWPYIRRTTNKRSAMPSYAAIDWAMFVCADDEDAVSHYGKYVWGWRPRVRRRVMTPRTYWA